MPSHQTGLLMSIRQCTLAPTAIRKAFAGILGARRVAPPKGYDLVDPCLIWQGPLSASGYARVNHMGREYRVARLMLRFMGAPPDAVAAHACDRPACVQPNHVWPKSQQENMADMVRRNRQARGEASGSAKLTEVQVHAIRLAAANGFTRRALAKAYGVSGPTISMAVLRTTWKHI